MSVPEDRSGREDKRETCKRKEWDDCIRKATKGIALGMLIGAVGSAFMGGSEIPLRVCTGLTVGWSVNRCKRLLTPPPAPPPPPKEEDPCACCFSDFQPLISDEFEDTTTQEPVAAPKLEEDCTCEARNLYEWSVPVPMEERAEEPMVYEDLPECTCDELPSHVTERM